MAVPSHIVDPRNGLAARVTEFGQLVVAPIAYSTPVVDTLAVVDTAVNFVEPVANHQVVITDIILSSDKNVGVDGAAVVGKWVSKNEFKNVDDINFSLHKNETVVQQGNTSLMLWKIDELIEYVSKYFTLKIGDIIFTGTPAGVSKVFANDKLTGYIENEELFSIKIK